MVWSPVSTFHPLLLQLPPALLPLLDLCRGAQVILDLRLVHHTPSQEHLLPKWSWHQNGQEAVAKPRLHFAVVLFAQNQKLRLQFSRSTRGTAVASKGQV